MSAHENFLKFNEGGGGATTGAGLGASAPGINTGLATMLFDDKSPKVFGLKLEEVLGKETKQTIQSPIIFLTLFDKIFPQGFSLDKFMPFEGASINNYFSSHLSVLTNQSLHSLNAKKGQNIIGH
jgi:hypothetical protein